MTAVEKIEQEMKLYQKHYTQARLDKASIDMILYIEGVLRGLHKAKDIVQTTTEQKRSPFFEEVFNTMQRDKQCFGATDSTTTKAVGKIPSVNTKNVGKNTSRRNKK